VTDDPTHYVGVDYATPYRGARIAERLDAAVAGDEPVDPDFHRELQRDVRDGRAVQLVPDLVAAVEDRTDGDAPETAERVRDAAAALDAWDRRMAADSRGALIFDRWVDRFRRLVFAPAFEAVDLGETYYPNDWVLATLPADDPLFADRSRAAAMVAALEGALDEIDESGWETYGDRNSTAAIAHPLGGEAPFLNYPALPADGSPATVMNYRVDDAVGSSWRMVVRPGEDATAVLPGGNSGDYFSERYDDQLRDWLANDQKPMSLDPDDGDDGRTVAFRGASP
jgi:penicillin amidase